MSYYHPTLNGRSVADLLEEVTQERAKTIAEIAKIQASTADYDESKKLEREQWRDFSERTAFYRGSN